MPNKFDKEKIIIGHLFKYYYKNANLSINEIIAGNDEYLQTICNTCSKCTNPERICSKNTLYRLFDGSIVTNECIYVRLANKLKKEIILDRYDIYDKIARFQKILYDNLVDLNATNLEKLESLITIEITKHKNILYVYEILSLYLNIIKDKLYPGYSPEKEDIQTYIYLKDFVEETDKKLILYYLYTGIFNRGNYGINYNETYNECEKFVDDPLFYERKLDCIFYMDQLKAYNYLVKDELPKYKSLNLYQQYCLFRKFQTIQVNNDSFNDAYNSIYKCYEIVQKSNFGLRISFATYLRLGFVTYCLKKYNESSDWLLKAFEVRNNLAKDFVMLFQSLEKINDTKKIKDILNKTNITLSKAPYGKKVYQYYSLKYKKNSLARSDISELEDFICDILKPYFDIYGQIHKDAFNEDLKKYVKITGNYKKYYDFNS